MTRARTRNRRMIAMVTPSIDTLLKMENPTSKPTHSPEKRNIVVGIKMSALGEPRDQGPCVLVWKIASKTAERKGWQMGRKTGREERNITISPNSSWKLCWNNWWRLHQPFLMAFFRDVSPYMLLVKQCEVTSVFHCFLHCLLFSAWFRTLSTLSHPFSQFLIKFRLCARFIFLSTMALGWGIIKLFPVELVLEVGYFHQWIVKNTVQDMLNYGLVPCTWKEIRVLAHTACLRKQNIPGMQKVVLIGIFCIFTLVCGFMEK